jgi:DNA-binding MarR family transcriptional regulator
MAHDLPLRDIAEAVDMDQPQSTRAVGVFVRDGLIELNTG